MYERMELLFFCHRHYLVFIPTLNPNVYVYCVVNDLKQILATDGSKLEINSPPFIVGFEFRSNGDNQSLRLSGNVFQALFSFDVYKGTIYQSLLTRRKDRSFSLCPLTRHFLYCSTGNLTISLNHCRTRKLNINNLLKSNSNAEKLVERGRQIERDE